jgi:hypothetical protein
MTLTDIQKNNLQQHCHQIKSIFNVYKETRNYMGVYFNTRNFQPYITFNNINNFRPSLRMAGNINIICCVFNCSEDFDEQVIEFLM